MHAASWKAARVAVTCSIVKEMEQEASILSAA